MGTSKEFEDIWQYVILPVRRVVEKECDPAFASAVQLHFRSEEKWKRRLEDEFHRQRRRFKRQCYSSKRQHTAGFLLDSRKVAAVLCQTSMRCKAFSFDMPEANKFASVQKGHLSDEAYTQWAVCNTLINYRFAYLVGIQLLYITLLAELMNKEETEELGKKLDNRGHLFRYPADPGCDSFDTNVVVGLARSDVEGQDLNMLLYAMLLYQVEMYARKCLPEACKQKE